MTREQRISAENGIWLCRDHATAVDSKDPKFTVELLRAWRAQAQADSWRRVLYNDRPSGVPGSSPPGEIGIRIRAAAATDLDAFRRSDKWPKTSIELTLEAEGLTGPVSTSALAGALATFDDLIIVAQPGMGKTTTLFQIAEAALASTKIPAIIVPLGAWSAGSASILESIVKRQAFRGLSEDDLGAAGATSGLVLLLDGWNELDSAARRRATTEIERLRMDLPELSLLISTRKQALDVPFDGKRINVLPLSERQQLDIARTLCGETGGRILDQAWRTAGVRELVTIPLYLTSLLALPEGEPFPTTKEEVLRRFVSAHERDPLRSEALAQVTRFHQRFLEDLAEEATRAARTALEGDVARKRVSETEDALVSERQIRTPPEPDEILDALINHHILVRSSEAAGISFPHQQLQEWYASHVAERLIMAGIADVQAQVKLKAEILNLPSWEEPILFACERLSRGSQQQAEACGVATLLAFAVDPMLAAEMIYRSTDTVWARVASDVQAAIKAWHKPGTVDRALRFMITSGRPEFLDVVWPLITHEKDQVRLTALREGRRFRPSILGSDAAKKISALPAEIRGHVLNEIASSGGMEGLDLASSIAVADPDPEVKSLVVAALAFRRADRHVCDVLRNADDATLKLVARKGLVEDLEDENAQKRLDAARQRMRKAGTSVYDRLHGIVYAPTNEDHGAELTALVAEIDIAKKNDAVLHLMHEARNRYPRAVAEGLLQRVRAGSAVPYRAQDMIAGSGMLVEDDSLLEIAMRETEQDNAADAAASMLGPRSVGRMIDKLFETLKQMRDENGQWDKSAWHLHALIEGRLRHAPGASLLAAIGEHSVQADEAEIKELADLISLHPGSEEEHGQPFEPAATSVIAALLEDWGNRLLASSNSTREQLASLASVAKHAPSITMLPLLKRLLDEELRCWRAARAQAKVENYCGPAANEARTGWTLTYQQTFTAIGGPETAALMREYLLDAEFGHAAALVLASLWHAANKPSDDNLRWRSSPDLSRVAEKRAGRAANPASSSPEGDAIFAAIDQLLEGNATEEQKKLALALAEVGVTLPHGERDETIGSLLAISPRRYRAKILTNLVAAGYVADIAMIRAGIAEVLEAVKAQKWILDYNNDEVKEWLRLLPFSNRPAEALAVILEAWLREPYRLEDVLDALCHAPGNEAENLLFDLADADPRLYAHRSWCDAVCRRGTLSAAKRFVDLVAAGTFCGASGHDQRRLSNRIAGLINQHDALRGYIYDLIRKGTTSKTISFLAEAVEATADVDGLILLIELKHHLGWRAIERVVTEHVPSESWKGAYNVLGVPAVELRRRLLAMTTDGGRDDVAARCLTIIDRIRDDYGIPEDETRHPDLASGKPWPIMTPNPDARENS